MLMVQIALPYHKLRRGMRIVTKDGIHTIIGFSSSGTGQPLIETYSRQLLYSSYEYSIIHPAEAYELIEDPIEKLAFAILAKDPQACDAARDILKC